MEVEDYPRLLPVMSLFLMDLLAPAQELAPAPVQELVQAPAQVLAPAQELAPAPAQELVQAPAQVLAPAPAQVLFFSALTLLKYSYYDAVIKDCMLLSEASSLQYQPSLPMKQFEYFLYRFPSIH